MGQNGSPPLAGGGGLSTWRRRDGAAGRGGGTGRHHEAVVCFAAQDAHPRGIVHARCPDPGAAPAGRERASGGGQRLRPAAGRRETRAAAGNFPLWTHFIALHSRPSRAKSLSICDSGGGVGARGANRRRALRGAGERSPRGGGGSGPGVGAEANPRRRAAARLLPRPPGGIEEELGAAVELRGAAGRGVRAAVAREELLRDVCAGREEGGAPGGELGRARGEGEPVGCGAAAPQRQRVRLGRGARLCGCRS